MFTLNKITFTEEKKSYFSNYSHLTKDLIKVIRLISYREKSVNTYVDNIKYNQLIHIIEKELKDKEINLLLLEKTTNVLKKYILEKMPISEELVDEIILLFFFNIENKNKETIKQSLFKKINLRITKIEGFFKKDIYSSKRRLKKEQLEVEELKKIITEAEYDDLSLVHYRFIQEFNYYKEFINKHHNYVLKPNAFVNYSEINSNDFLLKNTIILKKLNLYQQIIDLKEFFEELVYIMNMRLLSSEINPSPSFYLQDEIEDKYIEIAVINYEIGASYHGGKRFAHLCIGKSPLFHLKQKEMGNKFKDKKILQKITWDEPEFLEIKTYSESFLCDINYSNNKIYLLRDIFNEEKNKYDYKLLGYYECEEMFDIKTYANFSNKRIDGERLKGFFLFKTANDYWEINIFNRKDILILKMRFFIDKCEIVNCVNKDKIIKTYDELLGNN